MWWKGSNCKAMRFLFTYFYLSIFLWWKCRPRWSDDPNDPDTLWAQYERGEFNVDKVMREIHEWHLSNTNT